MFSKTLRTANSMFDKPDAQHPCAFKKQCSTNLTFNKMRVQQPHVQQTLCQSDVPKNDGQQPLCSTNAVFDEFYAKRKLGLTNPMINASLLQDGSWVPFRRLLELTHKGALSLNVYWTFGGTVRLPKV